MKAGLYFNCLEEFASLIFSWQTPLRAQNETEISFVPQ